MHHGGRARQRELDAMSKGDVFKSFYADLEELQAYHKKFPGLVERPVGLCIVLLEKLR